MHLELDERMKQQCMNAKCSSKSKSNGDVVESWTKGWPLLPGHSYATLCLLCGTAYKDLLFCEMFHSQDTGWRDCTSCGKPIHCGCIASNSLLLLLHNATGVICTRCANTSPPQPSQGLTAPDLSPEFGPTRQSDAMVSTLALTCNQSCIEPSRSNRTLQDNNVDESLVHTNLSIGLCASSNSNLFSHAITEEKESGTVFSSIQQEFKTHHLLPKLSSTILSAGIETKSRTISPIRVARPPVERRAKNQLLPRYWPRITDQELRQISGDSNSTVVPLFEKVLSASDAGRIGRLVLPKACAEAYFPAISQPEGLPLRIQDVKGKEWVFQFRFWPNNNSRMYVLEGVTPCIQSMHLQAGDTVTFSRMDPEGKLLMGFRKASNSVSLQDSHSSMYSSAFNGDPLLANAEIGLLQSLKGSGNSSSMSLYSKHVYPKLGDDQRTLPLQLQERKRSRNIGQKSKRLLMDGHDAVELKLSWDELQDLLRPPLCIEPSALSIEDHEFEEFEEPPVFGKRSIFIVRSLSGHEMAIFTREQEQWVQCDSCFKWRKVSCDLLLPPKWTCQDDEIDQTRSSCSAPDELNAMELENLVKMNKELKRQRVSTSLKSKSAQEYKDMESQENANDIGGDHTNEAGCSSSAAATTTKHPRHRPGCSCIVCIQPPSGKGKHKSTCTCNVCMTVKRRFKTLMMRKQKRQQSKHEAQETALRSNQLPHDAKEETEVDSVPNQVMSSSYLPKNSRSENDLNFKCHGNGGQQSQENAKNCGAKLDLNCCPGREHATLPRISMTSLVRDATLPLETYLKQNGLTSLITEQQPTSPRDVTEESPPESQDNHQNLPPIVQQQEEENGELSGKDQVENGMS